MWTKKEKPWRLPANDFQRSAETGGGREHRLRRERPYGAREPLGGLPRQGRRDRSVTQGGRRGRNMIEPPTSTEITTMKSLIVTHYAPYRSTGHRDHGRIRPWGPVGDRPNADWLRSERKLPRQCAY